MKKLFSILCVFALVLGVIASPFSDAVLTTQVSADLWDGIEDDEVFTSGNWVYAVKDDGTVRVKEYLGTDPDVVIPSALDGKTVTEIGWYPHQIHSLCEDCSFIKSIYIPQTVTTIYNFLGSYFIGCTSLVSINVSDKNPNYRSLDGVLYEYKDGKYKGLLKCPSVKKYITLPDSVEYISTWAFQECKELTGVKLNENLKSIERLAFDECTALQGITIPKSVTYIDPRAFEECTGIENYIVSDGNNNYCSLGGAIYCYAYDYDSEVRYVHTLLFCPNKKTVFEMPDSVEWIENDAFMNARTLQTLYLSKNLSGFYDEDVFYHCTALENFNIDNSNEYFRAIDGVLYYYDTDDGKISLIAAIPRGRKSVKIADGITEIPDSLFRECANLTNITLPNSVTTIGSYAFSFCENLTEIIIPDGVSTIGDNAFYACEKLEKAVISDSVTDLGSDVFNECYNLKSLTIGNGIKSIRDREFCGFKKLEELTIGSGVESIGEEAFYNCDSLKKVVIPETVTDIGNRAFGFHSVEIYDEDEGESWTSFEKIDDFTIYGYEWSEAEYYADWKDIKFIYLDEREGETLYLDLVAPEGSALAAETATITIDGDSVESVDGSFTLPALEDGEYEMTISAPNFVTRTYTVTVQDGAIVEDITPELNLIGDINGDGKLNAADLLKAKSHIKGASKLTDYELDCADVDNNGKVNAADLLKLKAHIKGVSKLWA